MPKNRYTPEEIIQHLRMVELETAQGLPVLDACRKLGITEQDAHAVFKWRALLHAQRSADSDRMVADPLQHGPPAQPSRGPATRSRNPSAYELTTHRVGGTTTGGRSLCISPSQPIN